MREIETNMTDLFTILKNKGVVLPENVGSLLQACNRLSVFDSTSDLAIAATNGLENVKYEVKYEVPGKGVFTEAVVHRVKNGISANFTEAYMRRRDPETMVIADNKPSDKQRFIDKYGYPFSTLQEETYAWLKEQEIGRAHV